MINTGIQDLPFQGKSSLLTVQNNILVAMKNKDCTALTLLDLPTAFNMIDQILLDRLKKWFGLGGDVLEWVVSNLKPCFQSVQISSIRSNPIKLILGVPQCSVLGSLLFIMDTTPLSSILSKAKDMKH